MLENGVRSSNSAFCTQEAGQKPGGQGGRKAAASGLILLDPLGYLDFLKLIAHARVVLTDSGGIQEETTILGTPCLTLRDNTERPVTVEMGTNRLVGSDPERILSAWREVIGEAGGPKPVQPPLWDGRAAQRIADILIAELRR